MSAARDFAKSVVIDHRAMQVYVDGIRLPWWLELDPEIVHREGGITALRIGVMCDGNGVIVGPEGDRVIVDAQLGNVGDWAREYVLAGLRERISWLTA